MTFGPLVLLEELSRLEFEANAPQCYVVALSGGLDSVVLLHALSSLRGANHIAASIHCIYVDHRLQAESADWRQSCANLAASLNVGFDTIEVDVAVNSGKGLEAAARDARYDALKAQLEPGDWLLSAHHRDDQAETLLLNLIRGSGPAGVAGIAGIRRFGSGWLARPLLNVDRRAIEKYAKDSGLDWIEDPSNLDLRFDRNFLRHDILPLLRGRWPDIAVRLQRSAAHAGEAAELLHVLAELDMKTLGERHPARLPIDRLTALPAARQRNVIRLALRTLNLTTPTTVQLDIVMTELLLARKDAQPKVRWPGACVRRYRNNLYLLPENLGPALNAKFVVGDTLDLGSGLGRLRLSHGADVGISERHVKRGLLIKCRVGGERIKPLGQRHTRKLKNLLQEEGIVPWMRDRLPLVYSGKQLIAVGDLWINADDATAPGVALHWDARPALH